MEPKISSAGAQIITPYTQWKDRKLKESSSARIECRHCRGSGEVACDCSCACCECYSECPVCLGECKVEWNNLTDAQKMLYLTPVDYLKAVAKDLTLLIQWTRNLSMLEDPVIKVLELSVYSSLADRSLQITSENAKTTNLEMYSNG